MGTAGADGNDGQPGPIGSVGPKVRPSYLIPIFLRSMVFIVYGVGERGVIYLIFKFFKFLNRDQPLVFQ